MRVVGSGEWILVSDRMVELDVSSWEEEGATPVPTQVEVCHDIT